MTLQHPCRCVIGPFDGNWTSIKRPINGNTGIYLLLCLLRGDWEVHLVQIVYFIKYLKCTVGLS